MGFAGMTIIFVSFMSILGIYQNKRIRQVGPSSNINKEVIGLNIMMRDSNRIKAAYEILLAQVEYVVTIFTNQGE